MTLVGIDMYEVEMNLLMSGYSVLHFTGYTGILERIELHVGFGFDDRKVLVFIFFSLGWIVAPYVMSSTTVPTLVSYGEYSAPLCGSCFAYTTSINAQFHITICVHMNVNAM